jgi:chemotaxis protein CheD
MRFSDDIPDQAVEQRRDNVGKAAKLTYLHPGQTVCSGEPLKVTTILGSCAAVTLWDPTLRVGGMTHFMLPEWDGTGSRTARYGDVAMTELLEALRRLGSNMRSVQARVFGGGCVLNVFRAVGSHLGARNVNVAIEALSRERIAIIQRDILGSVGRKITFDIEDGSVNVQLIGNIGGA